MGQRKNKEVGSAAKAFEHNSAGVNNQKALKPAPKITKGSSNGKTARPDKANIGEETKPEDVKDPSNGTAAKPNKVNIGDETHQPKDTTAEAAGGSNQVKEESVATDKENIGGVIFMCNNVTKPDCFRYKIMGLPQYRIAFVQQIKIGTKLFLYDFQLKMLHGIFKASSAGGMNLEPAAFKGSYPAQVRFEVEVDRAPLPEHVFKNALKESHLGNKKMFNTVLSVEEVKELTKLFHPLPEQRATPQAYGLKQPPVVLAPSVAHGIITAGVPVLPHRPPAAYESSSSQVRVGDVYHGSQLWGSPPAPRPAPIGVLPSYAPVMGRAEHGASVEDRLRIPNSTHGTNSTSGYGAAAEKRLANSSAHLGSMPVSARYSFAGPTMSYK